MDNLEPNNQSLIKFARSANPRAGEAELSNLISSELSTGSKLLWIVSGGSNIPIATRIMFSLKDELTKNLQLLLSDERYGPASHQDSNYSQLMQAGFNPKRALFEPVLDDNLDLNQTISHYKELFDQKTAWASLVIGQLGIGDDGHIAGILPSSPVVNSFDEVVYYESGPYKRLSLSLEALKHIDLDRTFCFGTNKLSALTRLASGTETLESLPSLILNNIANVKVYNDQLGDN